MVNISFSFLGLVACLSLCCLSVGAMKRGRVSSSWGGSPSRMVPLVLSAVSTKPTEGADGSGVPCPGVLKRRNASHDLWKDAASEGKEDFEDGEDSDGGGAGLPVVPSKRNKTTPGKEISSPDSLSPIPARQPDRRVLMHDISLEDLRDSLAERGHAELVVRDTKLGALGENEAKKFIILTFDACFFHEACGVIERFDLGVVERYFGAASEPLQQGFRAHCCRIIFVNDSAFELRPLERGDVESAISQIRERGGAAVYLPSLEARDIEALWYELKDF